MLRFDYSFRHEFHPVGQGLFAMGALFAGDDPHEPRFRWIYDCGTTSSPKLVDAAIMRIAPGAAAPKIIDLVTISHFDTDHISGLLQLLATHRVENLLLPFLPLWRRLMIGFELGLGVRHAHMAFLRNPAAHLRARFGDKLGRILFVPPSGHEGPPIGRRGDGPLPEPGSRWKLDYSAEEPSDEDGGAEIDGDTVQILKRGASLTVAGCWEFVPYNDVGFVPPLKARDLAAFKAAVAEKRDKLLNHPSRTTLAELKLAYNGYFGTTKEEKNGISLFLYCGPLGGDSRSHIYNQGGAHCGCYADRFDRAAILYTGDGFLDKHNRWAQLESFLHARRIRRISCLQVMHHGSQYNWHPGISQLIKPDVSVFSSDPHHKKFGHPHQEVLRDFWSFNPIQVDKVRGVAFSGWGER